MHVSRACGQARDAGIHRYKHEMMGEGAIAKEGGPEGRVNIRVIRVKREQEENAMVEFSLYWHERDIAYFHFCTADIAAAHYQKTYWNRYYLLFVCDP